MISDEAGAAGAGAGAGAGALDEGNDAVIFCRRVTYCASSIRPLPLMSSKRRSWTSICDDGVPALGDGDGAGERASAGGGPSAACFSSLNFVMTF